MEGKGSLYPSVSTPLFVRTMAGQRKRRKKSDPKMILSRLALWAKEAPLLP